MFQKNNIDVSLNLTKGLLKQRTKITLPDYMRWKHLRKMLYLNEFINFYFFFFLII